MFHDQRFFTRQILAKTGRLAERLGWTRDHAGAEGLRETGKAHTLDIETKI